MLEVRDLSKWFGKFRAVDDVSFTISRGELVGLVGPNGAGKSTIIHMLLGLIRPSSGYIGILGREFHWYSREILQHVNFLSPYVVLPFRLTVLENLRVFARLYNLADGERRISELLETFGIEHLTRTQMWRLSSGEGTRVGLCKALLNYPELLLLDEPTAFLDPQIAHQVRQLLLKNQREHNTAILYTSHNMSDVETMCDRVVFLHRGRLIASGTPIEVTQSLLAGRRETPALEEVFLRVARSA
jgi:ABC-2 type transport system ATP-binding protein